MLERVGFGRRLVAYIIDWIILGIGTAVLMGIFGLSAFNTAMTTGQEVAFGAMQLVGSILILVWCIGYVIVLWAATGQTIGKMIMGIKIVLTNGGSIGLGTAIVRFIGYMISGVVFYLGFLWIIWDKEKQGWHDKIAGTYVVRK